MAWPLSQDYNEAIQDPASCFAEPDLKSGQVVLNALGMPLPRSGNFADVYEFQGGRGSKWAVKCFTRQIPGLRERYQQISLYLKQVKLPFMVDFTFLDKGIRIRGEWYPILKMEWVEGFTLNQLVRNHLDKPQVLETLCRIWVKLASRLRQADIAHCDLQHGNVLLVPGSKAGALGIKLVDYDGMCVPALTLLKWIELGHPSFQHPQRLREGIYSLEVDRFSHLVIYTALRGLIAAGRPLWKRYDNGDNMLFREADLREPGKSVLFKELWNIPDAALHDLVGYLALGATGPLEETPLLQDVVIDNQTRPLSPAQERQVTVHLGPGARVQRPAPLNTIATAVRPSRADRRDAAASSAITAASPAGAFAFDDEPLPQGSVISFDTDVEEDQSPARFRKPHSAGRAKKGLFIGIGAAIGAVVATVVAIIAIGAGSSNDPGKNEGRELEKQQPQLVAKAADDKAGQNDPPRHPEPKPKPQPRPVLPPDPPRDPPDPPRDRRDPPRDRRDPPRDRPDPPRDQQGSDPVVVKSRGKVPFQVTGNVWKIAISPDSRFALTSEGFWVRLWELPSGREVGRLEQRTMVNDVAFSPDGRRALVGGGRSYTDNNGKATYDECTMRLWDLETFKVLKTFPHKTQVSAVAFSPDGRHAASGSGMTVYKDNKSNPVDCVVRLWDLESGEEIKEFGKHPNPVFGVSFSSDGKQLFATCFGAAIHCWNIKTGDLAYVFSQRGHWTIAAADGRQVAGMDLKRVFLWDREGRQISSFDGVKSVVRSIAVSADMARAVVGSGEFKRTKDGDQFIFDANKQRIPFDNTARLVDLKNGKRLAHLTGMAHEVAAVALSPDGKFALVGGPRCLFLWDLKTDRVVGDPKLVASVRVGREAEPEKTVKKPKPTVDDAPRENGLVDKKEPVPNADKLAEATKRIKARFEEEYQKTRPADRLELAAKLLKEAEQSNNLPDRYALRRESSLLAARAGDLPAALTALEEINKEFAGEVLDLKAAAAASVLETGPTPLAAPTTIGKVLELIDEAVALDSFAVARKLVEHAETWARGKGKDYLKAVQARGQEAEETQKQFESVKAAAKTLEQLPKDPEASLAWGKYLCFWKGSWKEGLPLLAQGSDAALEMLAKTDLADPAKPAAQVELAGDWHKLAPVENGPPKTQLLGRAVLWYRRALPELDKKADQTHVENMIKEIDKLVDSRTLDIPGEARVFTGHTGRVNGVGISRDGQTILSGCEAGTVRLWSMKTGQEVRKFNVQRPVRGIVLSPNAKYAVAFDTQPQVMGWELGTERSTMNTGYPGSLNCVAVAPGGTKVILGGSEGKIIKIPWDGERGRESSMNKLLGTIKGVALAGNERLLVFLNVEGSACLYNFDTRRVLSALKTGRTGRVLCVALSRDGTQVFTGGVDKSVRVWNSNTGQLRSTWKRHRSQVDCIALSANGKRLLSGSYDKTVILWDVKTKTPSAIFKGHTGAITSVALSGDGRFAVSGSEDKTVRVWRLPK